MLTIGDLDLKAVNDLLLNQGLRLTITPPATDIPGSYWGNPEAGLIQNRIFARTDTPVHSLLHEACHYICMPPERQATLHTDAGGSYTEEDAVCYLQILLADQIPGYSSQQCLQDMDQWGYTFRLGSARSWFEEDADEALHWLIEKQLIQMPPPAIRMPEKP
ncbi:MAG TPA: hypothetical protein ENJ84_05815 [Gammaproteobacteria bacterium]|nr:hypothetical protein [Gammaproteobacteria bacterium]